MSLLAYAVAERDAGLIDGVGLDERPLVGIEHDGLALVVSQHEYPLPEPTAKLLWRYEEVRPCPMITGRERDAQSDEGGKGIRPRP